MIAYSAVKDSGIEWMGTIPEHWKVKKLKLLGEAITGLTYSPNDIVNEDEGILVLRASNIKNGQITFDDNVYVNTQIPSKLITRENDILICSRNGSRRLIGKSALINEQSSGLSFGAFTTVFRSGLSEYLFYVFQSPLFEFQIGTFLTSTINQLTIGNLNSLQIPVPSKEEQKAIVNYLRVKTKEIDLLLEQKQLLISLLEQQRQSIITEAVTKGLNPSVKMKDSGVEWIGEIPEHWQQKKLKYFVSYVKGLAFKSEWFLEDGIKVVKTTDIKNGGTINLSNTFVSKEIAEEYTKVKVLKGDVLMSTVGSAASVVNSAVGQLGLVTQEFDGALLNQNAVKLKGDSKVVDNKFLFYFLNNKWYREYLNIGAHGTANQASLSIEYILDFTAILPTVAEQLDIVDYIEVRLNQISDLITSITKEIEKLKEYRQSIIYEAVTGKIDVRDMKLD